MIRRYNAACSRYEWLQRQAEGLTISRRRCESVGFEGETYTPDTLNAAYSVHRGRAEEAMQRSGWIGSARAKNDIMYGVDGAPRSVVRGFHPLQVLFWMPPWLSILGGT